MSYSGYNILRMPNIMIAPDTYTGTHLNKIISFVNYNTDPISNSTFSGEKCNCISIDSITNTILTTTKKILVRVKLTTLLTAAGTNYVDWAIYNSVDNSTLGMNGRNGFFYNTSNKLSTLNFGNYEAIAIIPANTSFYIKCFSASGTAGAALNSIGSNIAIFQLEQ
jgi:hypothetical protein